MIPEKITLDWLEAWWLAHPEARAERSHACNCIVAVPLRDVAGSPASFCPANMREAHVWVAGTDITRMRPDNYGGIVTTVPVEEVVDDMAFSFDVDGGGTVGAEQCIEIIRKAREEAV